MVAVEKDSGMCHNDEGFWRCDMLWSCHVQAMAWAAFNGAGLAFVLPCAQSILADYYIPEQRGRAFGFMFTLAALGEVHFQEGQTIEESNALPVQL